MDISEVLFFIVFAVLGCEGFFFFFSLFSELAVGVVPLGRD